jgi:hypothetical protein
MTAQKLIVLKEDKTVVPTLKNIVRDNEGFFARLFHPGKTLGWNDYMPYGRSMGCEAPTWT